MDNNTNQPAVGKETVEQEDKQKKRLQNVLEYAESLALVFAVMLLIFTFIGSTGTPYFSESFTDSSFAGAACGYIQFKRTINGLFNS